MQTEQRNVWHAVEKPRDAQREVNMPRIIMKKVVEKINQAVKKSSFVHSWWGRCVRSNLIVTFNYNLGESLRII